jgi:predicted SprT family Zn-dependent metalloprotease
MTRRFRSNYIDGSGNWKKYPKARDFQRSRVYKFGWEIAEGTESWGPTTRTRSRTYEDGGRLEWDDTWDTYQSAMTEEESIKFLDKAHRWWYGDTENKLYDIRVKFLKRGYRGTSFYRPTENTLNIKKWGMNKNVLLHELTHYIIGRSTRKEFRCEPSHGKIFMRIFATLLARFTNVKMTEIKRVAKKHKVKMCGLKDSNGKNIRRKLKQS